MKEDMTVTASIPNCLWY